MQKYTLFILVIAATISASAAKQLDRSPVYPIVPKQNHKTNLHG